MTPLLVDPAPGEAAERNLTAALLASQAAGDGAARLELTRTRLEQSLSARERALLARTARYMVVIDQRATSEGRIWYDDQRPRSMGLALALARILSGLGHPMPPHPCPQHEVFGRRRRSAHRSAVVVLVAGTDVPAPALAHALVRLAQRLAAL